MKEIDFNELRKKFSTSDIEWRIQSSGRDSKNCIYAQIVPYLTNRAIMQRLDDVVGCENWKNEYRETTCEKYVTDFKTKVKSIEKVYGFICGLSIKINGEWVTKYDGAENTDIQTVKGGISDSMKRSAVQWGMGRELYDTPKTYANVSLERKYGWESAKLKDGTKYWWLPPTSENKQEQPKQEPPKVNEALDAKIKELESYYSIISPEAKELCVKAVTQRNETFIYKYLEQAKNKRAELDAPQEQPPDEYVLEIEQLIESTISGKPMFTDDEKKKIYARLESEWSKKVLEDVKVIFGNRAEGKGDQLDIF